MAEIENQNAQSVTKISWDSKVCLVVSLSIFLVGFAGITGFHSQAMELFSLFMANPLIIVSFVFGGVGIFAAIWLYCTNRLAFIVLNNLFASFLVGLATYLLSFKENFLGVHYAAIWGPAAMQLGVFLLAACVSKHRRLGLERFFVQFPVYQALLAYILFIVLFSLHIASIRDREIAAQASFLRIKDGKDTAPETVDFQGARFECSIESGKADCDPVT